MKVRIEGRGMERFFNIAAQRGITITEIETKETKKARKAGSVGKKEDRVEKIHAAEYSHRQYTQKDECIERNEYEKDNAEMEKTVYFWTSPRNFKRLKPIARKTDVRLRITEKHGFPFCFSWDAAEFSGSADWQRSFFCSIVRPSMCGTSPLKEITALQMRPCCTLWPQSRCSVG